MSDDTAFGPLVDAQWLKEHLRDEDVRVLDVRWYLAGKTGADEYARGHIPSAVFIDLDRDITGHPGPGRHPIPGAARFQSAMRTAGVSPTTRVVAYDDTGGSVAARLWWLLRHYGHAHVAVLDGGLAAWRAAGGELDTGVPEVAEGSFVASVPDHTRVVDKAYIAAARDAPDVLLIDARAPERYRGETEPVDARPGHIPGAKNAPWSGNLAEGRFATPDVLKSRFESLGVGKAREVIVYCGSGVTACHDLLAMEIAGLPGARLYEGSWSDWARDSALPAATGE